MMIHEARFRPSEHKLLCALMTNDALLASTLYQGEINENLVWTLEITSSYSHRIPITALL